MSLASLIAIALAVAAVAGGLVVTLLQRGARQAAGMRAEAGLLAAFTNTAPGGYYFWDARDGRERASADLAATLGARDGPLAAFADLAPCFDEADYARLTTLIGALRGQDSEFTAHLAAADGNREFTAKGQTVRDGSGRKLGFIVWLRDVDGTPGADIAGSGEGTAAASRSEFAQILDTIPLPVWRRNDSLDIVWWNAAFSTAVGGATDTARDRDLFEFSSPPFARRARALAESARAADAGRREVRMLVVDGERRTFEVAEQPVEGGMIGVARDITESTWAGGELERHIAAHDAVLEQLGTPVVIWGPDRRLKFSNRAFAEVFRLDESRLADEPLHDEVLEMLREDRLIPEQADFQAYKRRFRDMYTTLTEPVEELIHLPDGRSLRVSRAPHPLGGLLFSYEDVSGQLELERSRNTLAAVQQTTLDNLTQAVAVFGGDGRLKLWNRTYAELWGYSDELLAGEPHLAELFERAMPIVSIFSDGVPDGTRPWSNGLSTAPRGCRESNGRTV